VHGLSREEIGIYAVSWLVAFLASLSRSARDADGVSVIRVLGLGSTSGFFAIGSIGLIWGDPDGANPMYLIGLSALVGLTSKEQEKYVQVAFSSVASRIGKFFSDKGGE